MPRRRKSHSRKHSGGKRRVTAWNRKFGAAGKACFKEGPTSGKQFGACMRRKLRGR